MHQVTIFATITPHAAAALLADTGNDPATTTPDPDPATPSQPAPPASSNAIYPLTQPPICGSRTQIMERARKRAAVQV
jgi:hypothetical protein